MDMDGCHCNVPVLKPNVESHRHGKCPIKPCSYQTLPSETSIRLLKLHTFPGTNHSCEKDLFSPLKCSLVTVDLSDNPAYAALSYTWGDPKIYYSSEDEIVAQSDWYCQCHTMEIDGEEVTISTNLYTALISLRYVKSAARYAEHNNVHEDCIYIWIDALCINQSDVSEKSSQVQLMGRIYSQSLHVLVWLGGADPISDSSIVLLEMLIALCLPTRNADGKYIGLELLPEMALDDPRFYEILGLSEHISIQIWSRLFAFLNRSWFRRAWVIQELGLAVKATFICGLHLFNDAHLRKWILLLSDMKILSKLEDLEPLLVSGHELTEHQLLQRASWPTTSSYSLYKSQDVNAWDIDMFMFLEYVRQKRKESKEISLLDQTVKRNAAFLPISQTIMLYRSTEASDPRDKIYAFLGISHGGTVPIPQSLAPNYSLSPRQVYIQWAEFMISSDTHLCLLSMVEDHSVRKMDGIPSWVPDFSTECRPVPFRRQSPLPFCADRGLGPMLAAFSEPGVLEVRGYKLNRITATAKSSDLEQGGIKAIAEFLSALPQGMMIKQPNTPLQQGSTTVDVDTYMPQSRLDFYWRTLITDRFTKEQHPAPQSCGQAMRISFRRCLSQTAADLIHNSKTGDEFTQRWQSYMEDNAAWESLLLPGEITPLQERLAEANSAARETQTSQLIVLNEDEDFGPNTPTELLANGQNLPWEIGLEADYMYRKKVCQKMRKLVIISPGGLGLAPDSVAIDDEVWIIAGSQVPFILRPVGENRYKLVGEAYVHGVMHGEAMEGVDVRYLGIRNILLV
ncbi:HET-domain-containing protein [Mollisia scopiformis]|uniref:HET-domain-containing protein n=1 Tax=Mollisia scopiformis TaxID=149040 RepID=A0A194XU79_MOLSC|nr:HET-domain-containing protein [Mollisia scopiformis]KUJ23875.1 HET-domain-containing protein [Mollisia scopiformis]